MTVTSHIKFAQTPEWDNETDRVIRAVETIMAIRRPRSKAILVLPLCLASLGAGAYWAVHTYSLHDTDRLTASAVTRLDLSDTLNQSTLEPLGATLTPDQPSGLASSRLKTKARARFRQKRRRLSSDTPQLTIAQAAEPQSTYQSAPLSSAPVHLENEHGPAESVRKPMPPRPSQEVERAYQAQVSAARDASTAYENDRAAYQAEITQRAKLNGSGSGRP